ncbi:MAG: sigma 54-interacting transcriptional regulator [Pseudomonadota bacterium]
MAAAALLKEFMEALLAETGASHVAVLLHGEPQERTSMMLDSAGAAEAVPEFADDEAAWEFVAGTRQDEAQHDGCVQLASRDSDCVILRIAFGQILERPQPQGREAVERRHQPDIATAPASDGALWIGLRGAAGAERFAADVQSGLLSHVLMRLMWAVYHYAGLQQDPVTSLPGRTQLGVFARRAIAASRGKEQHLSLMLVNPDDFAMINHRYGRRQGDEALHQTAQYLKQHLRRTDGVFHYGGAVFAAVLPATDADQCRAAARKLRRALAKCRFVDDTVSLTFSIGAAVATADNLVALPDIEDRLSLQANAALNAAKLSGGARIVVADVDGSDQESGELLNPLTGIFAADTEKDYRNMLLLWETVALISTQAEPAKIAEDFVDRIAIGFRPDRAALFVLQDEKLAVLASSVRDETAPDGRGKDPALQLDAAATKLVMDTLSSGNPGRTRKRDAEDPGLTAYAVPLVARDTTLACLFLDARCERLRLDSSDIVFLNALATQMAVAMDRAELAARWISEKESESRQLREEVRELRQAVHHTRMVFQSSAMHSVMQTLHKVAPTDATVLIIGESGTGKEMLAKSLHDFSNRQDKPFVIFDCGAVAKSLLEAELFGHTKGAYTGADRASEGLIAQADGGTLFLDEIGELPLDVQAKLLRFVQEKQYSPLGSATSRTVDVRIVAATNRELQDEVGAGRFRADLYYRLRVIAVQAVPLRERTDDIMPLARYFQEKFSAQYQASPKRFSYEAEQKLLSYSWPGNVRELQHCVLRAVLTQDSEVLDAAAIEVFPDAAGGRAPVEHAAAAPASSAVPVTPTSFEAVNLQPHDDPWPALGAELARQVSHAVAQNRRRPVPLGRWLNDDIVLAAHAFSSNVVRRAAKLVGVPDSTFRRQLDKATADAVDGVQNRPAHWQPVKPLIRRVIEHASTAHGDQENLLDRARDALLDCVHVEIDSQTSAGAALMGVTPPTYKRWLHAREQLQ